jgi:hypothetical protein
MFSSRNIGNDPQVFFSKMSGRGEGRTIVVVDADMDEARTTLARPIEKIKVFIDLGTNVFEYGQKSAADTMRTSLEKLEQYTSTNKWQDISMELPNKITVDII